MLAVDLEPKRHSGSGRVAQVVCANRTGTWFQRTSEWTPGRAIYRNSEFDVEIRWQMLDGISTAQLGKEVEQRRQVEVAQALDQVEVRGLPVPSTLPFWVTPSTFRIECVTADVELALLLRNLWESPDVRVSAAVFERGFEEMYRLQPELRWQPDWPKELRPDFRRESAPSNPAEGLRWLPVETLPGGIPAVLCLESDADAKRNARLVLSRRCELPAGTELHRIVEVSSLGEPLRESQVVARIVSARFCAD